MGHGSGLSRVLQGVDQNGWETDCCLHLFRVHTRPLGPYFSGFVLGTALFMEGIADAVAKTGLTGNGAFPAKPFTHSW